jgi:cytoskeleton protein RodZ
MPAAGTAPAAPLPQGQIYGQNNHGARLVLRVHTPTKVLVQGEDGMVYINRTLQPGDTYQVPNVVGLTLTTTNANAVEFDLDGQAMGFAGKDGGIAEGVSLDPQSIVDRHSGGQQ